MRLLFIIVGGILRWSFYALLLTALCSWIFLRIFAWQASERETQLPEKTAPQVGQYVTAGDIRLYIQESGTLKGEDVILVPGLGGWSGVWQPTADALVDAGYRVIAIDLPPFGFSQRPKLAYYDRQSQAERIIGALDALGIDSTIIVAHSTGGAAAMEAALMAPKRVRALVLIDAMLDIAYDRRGRRYPSFVVDEILSRVSLRDGLVATFITNPLFNEDILRKLVRDPATITKEWLKRYRQPLTLKSTTTAIGEWLPHLILLTRESRSENPDAYLKMRTPVHVIWGDSDPIAPYAQGRQFVAMLPGTVLKTMHGVGHLPHVEAPKEFQYLLIRSLSTIMQDYNAKRGGNTSH
jgi:pimeloyl-ACP methyl ester carboxylesterase